MGCDFKVGDEVTLCGPTPWSSARKWYQFWRPARTAGLSGPVFGEVIKIIKVGVLPKASPYLFAEDLPVLGFSGWNGAWFSALRFRKVQRRDLSVWLATGNTIEGPTRAPAKERT